MGDVLGREAKEDGVGMGGSRRWLDRRAARGMDGVREWCENGLGDGLGESIL